MAHVKSPPAGEPEGYHGGLFWGSGLFNFRGLERWEGGTMGARIVGWAFVILTALGGLYFGFIGGLVLGGTAYLSLSLVFPDAMKARFPKG